MTYPQQPGQWGDPSWQSSPPGDPQPGQQPGQQAGQQPGQQGEGGAGYPAAPGSGAGADPAAGYQPGVGYDPGSGNAAPPAAGPYGYQAPYGYPGYGYPPPNPPTNTLAIAALVLALVGIGSCITAPIGAVMGHVAQRQIRERGEGGEGLAKAAIIVGWILTGLFALLLLLYGIGIAVAIFAEMSTTTGGN